MPLLKLVGGQVCTVSWETTGRRERTKFCEQRQFSVMVCGVLHTAKHTPQVFPIIAVSRPSVHYRLVLHQSVCTAPNTSYKTITEQMWTTTETTCWSLFLQGHVGSSEV